MRFAPLALFGLVACGPVAPGDYVVYRVAFETGSVSPDCYGDGEVPDDIAFDTSTFRSGATFVVWRTVDDQYFLDNGGLLIAGTDQGSGSFVFTGTSTDVEVTEGISGTTTTYGYTYGGIDPKTTTLKNTTTISATLQGQTITGTQTVSLAQTCEKRGCEDYDTFSCTQTGTFVGTRVKDADLDYDLGGSADATGL